MAAQIFRCFVVTNFFIMSTYLLLRDNKESGPYTLQELIAHGMKAYDLIWVQGKSAAWRYPGEVMELKAHAPLVEEQPFDRFFRKQEDQQTPVEAKVETSSEANVEKEIQQPKPASKGVIEPGIEAYKPRPSVFVTLPNNQTISTSLPKKEIPRSAIPPQPVEEVKPTITVSENPAAAQIKYSQPLDEIKEMYVKTLQDRKQKIAFRSFVMQSLKKASIILVLVLIGVFAGFMIKSNKASVEKVESTVLSQPAVIDEDAPQQEGELSALQAHAGEPTIDTQDEMSEIDRKMLDELIAKSRQQKRAVPQANQQLLLSNPEEDIRSSYEFQNAETNPANGERSRRTRNESANVQGGNEVSEEREVPATKARGNDLSSRVSVKSNEYKVVAFGGIRDLQLTISNNSKYELDEVVVELQYLKPSELPLKTENIRFSSIKPNSTETLRIPDTNRGIKVKYQVIRVDSREAELEEREKM